MVLQRELTVVLRGKAQDFPVVRLKAGRLSIWGSGYFTSIRFKPSSRVFRGIVHASVNDLGLDRSNVLRAGQVVGVVHGSDPLGYKVQRSTGIGRDMKIAGMCWHRSFAPSSSLCQVASFVSPPDGSVQYLVKWARGELSKRCPEGGVIVWEGHGMANGRVSDLYGVVFRALGNKEAARYHAGALVCDIGPRGWDVYEGGLHVWVPDVVSWYGSPAWCSFPRGVTRVSGGQTCCRGVLDEDNCILWLGTSASDVRYAVRTSDPGNVGFIPWITPVFKGAAIFPQQDVDVRITRFGEEVVSWCGRCGKLPPAILLAVGFKNNGRNDPNQTAR